MAALLPTRADCLADRSLVAQMHAGVCARRHGSYILIGNRAHSRCVVASGRRFYVMLDDVAYALCIDDVSVRRDPLVAALFGEVRRDRTESKDLATT